MISERLFSRSYGSFWRDLLPFAEAFVRGVNAQWSSLDDEIDHPEPLKRAILNEGSVRLYRRIAEGRTGEQSEAEAAVAEAASWIGAHGFEVDVVDLLEVAQMAECLAAEYGRKELIFSPTFCGAGILSSCEGDFISELSLVEVKSGYRGFRSSDFRQILTYLALNQCNGIYKIEKIDLFNARLNRRVSLTCDDLCLQLGGDASFEILSQIVDFVTGGVLSGL